MLCFHIFLSVMLLWFQTAFTQRDAQGSGTTQLDSIELTLSHTGRNRVKMRCDARGLNVKDSLIMLSCPSVVTGVCQENCVHPCPIIQGSPSCLPNFTTPIKNCDRNLLSNSHMRIDYDIELDSPNSVGHWRCMFRGKTSNAVYLDYHLPEEKNEEQDGNSNKMEVASADADVDSRKEKGMRPDDLKEFDLGNFGNLHKGEPRDFCLDHMLCLKMSRLPRRRLCAEYNPLREATSYYQGTGFSNVVNPSSPIFVQHHLRGQPNALLPLSPLTVRNFFPMSPRPTQKYQRETVYDEVHNSVYTTLSSSARVEQPKQLMATPKFETPDGQRWILDSSSQFYLPYAHSTTPPTTATNYQFPSQDRHSQRLPPPPLGDALLLEVEEQQSRSVSKEQSPGGSISHQLSAVQLRSKPASLEEERHTQFGPPWIPKPKIEIVRAPASDDSRSTVELSEEATYSFPDLRFHPSNPLSYDPRPPSRNESRGEAPTIVPLVRCNQALAEDPLTEQPTSISIYEHLCETPKLAQVASPLYLEDWTISESTDLT
ncbi:hypothetical protein CRM22_010101 [Opisthorchis felineus]|uniref:Uncharacterized protein n=1 Tax=Opisthorchis felineus TaxID=147828 RepID=A0A4S2L213_OPIFE|nr:hypothetical protein CRM22_010101 [Opisthorchis felineus]